MTSIQRRNDSRLQPRTDRHNDPEFQVVPLQPKPSYRRHSEQMYSRSFIVNQIGLMFVLFMCSAFAIITPIWMLANMCSNSPAHPETVQR